MKHLVNITFLMHISLGVTAQTERERSPVVFDTYVEIYYLYDFNKPADHDRPSFIYSHDRHNEVNVNLAFLRATFSEQFVRGKFAMMAGTYTNANLASEPGALKNIFEANAGARISQRRNIWMDAGIFPSHIGFESAVGKDSWNLTRSLLADNTPYYESGIKLSYTNKNESWFISALVLNGWQRIQRIPGNSLPSFGTQVTYKPTSSITLNSSTFVGTDTPDSARLMRYFHNFYSIITLSDNVGLTFGFDYGAQQKTVRSRSLSHWLSPVLVARIAINEKASMDFRVEYYQDRHNIIIKPATSRDPQITAFSTNFDYQISTNLLWRIEFRHMQSKNDIFYSQGDAFRNISTLTTAFAISF